MPLHLSALNPESLTVSPETLFNAPAYRNDPHLANILLNEFDADVAPFYSGFTPGKKTTERLLQSAPRLLMSELGRNLLAWYEETGRNKPHAVQRAVLEKAIRLLRKGGEETDPLHIAKAYLHRSRIIRPREFSLPAKKKEALKTAADCCGRSEDPLAGFYAGLIGLEKERCDLIGEAELAGMLKAATAETPADRLADPEMDKGFYRMRVRLAEIEGGPFDSADMSGLFDAPDAGLELEKLKAVALGKEASPSPCRDALLARLGDLYFSHPLWEDTVRFLRRLHAMPPSQTTEGLTAFQIDFALKLWETAESRAQITSALHLRWHWSRQRDLYDIAFLSAIEREDWQKAAEIADSAKNRPALTWRAMERIGQATEELDNVAAENVKAAVEAYARALAGGYIRQFNNPPVSGSGVSLPDRAPKNGLIAQFYLVHLPNFEKGHVLICDDTGWSGHHEFDFKPVWEAYQVWQAAYFDLPAGNRWDSAPQLRVLCEALGEKLAFLFGLNPSETVKDLLIAPHDFLHRVPIHGALLNGTPLLNRFDCRYAISLTSHELAKTENAAESVPDNLPIWFQYPKTNGMESFTELYGDFEDDGKIDTEKSRLEASGYHVLNLSGTPVSTLILCCHGQADATNPFLSKLLLKKPLKLLDIAAKQNLCVNRVFLGACETDMMPRLNAPLDEHLSIASIFLNKGASAVIGTLWEASDQNVERILFEPSKAFDDFHNQQRKLKKNNDHDYMKAVCFRIWA